MYESYTVGGDALQSLGKQYYAAKNFTPRTAHILNFVDINLRTLHSTRAPSIWIYLADAQHKPTGNYLSKSLRHYADDWNLYHVFRMRADMEAVLLAADTEYVIVIHAFAIDIHWHMRWQYDNGDATYPRGIRLSSSDYGVTWTPHPNDDHMFVEFGSAPLPPPPPDPPTTKWFITDLTYEDIDTGLKLIITTNVPCHLYMRYTWTKPQEHMSTIYKRGIAARMDKYYCFVVWHDNEQEEVGDTLVHTFIKDPWAVCETRYFYFHGEIAGVASPSVTCIFQKHRLAIEYEEMCRSTGSNTAILSCTIRRGMTIAFQPTEDFEISRVDFTLARNIPYEPLAGGVFAIYDTGVACEPLLPPLTSVQFSVNVDGVAVYYPHTVTFPPVSLDHTKIYALGWRYPVALNPSPAYHAYHEHGINNLCLPPAPNSWYWVEEDDSWHNWNWHSALHYITYKVK